MSWEAAFLKKYVFKLLSLNSSIYNAGHNLSYVYLMKRDLNEVIRNGSNNDPRNA